MHHHFEPTVYHNTMGRHEPVLTVASGDRLTTTTVDAWGLDAERQQVATRGNPMTGPFAVAGAAPGDVLAVTIESIVPNRSYGFTKTAVAPHIVDPSYVTALPAVELVEWTIDTAAATVTLMTPHPAPLRGLILPLDPMLGCFGVAPPRGQSISTATSGEWGGNMDYRQLGPGATVYFPVFKPGGLFYLGDAHAVQGDGEISGNGVEISTTTTVRFEVLKGWKTSWPRFEREEWFGTLGNARPLDQAVQHATTEMLRWLSEPAIGLDSLSANLLLQQTVRYDLGNVFDPAYTMVCKLSRSILRKAGLPDSVRGGVP